VLAASRMAFAAAFDAIAVIGAVVALAVAVLAVLVLRNVRHGAAPVSSET